MVEYITIGKKQYPVRIGYYVMKKVQEKTGLSLAKALQEHKEDIALHETVLFAALKMGAYAEGTELDLTEEDMPMCLDLCFAQYMKLFTSDKFFPEVDEPGKPEEEPKKSKEN